MRKLITVLAITGLAMALLAGCSSDDSSDGTSTTAATSSTTKDRGRQDSKSFSVETPDGQASISLDGRLPPNWPADFPAPAKSEVAGSGSVAGSSSGVMVGVYTTKQSGSDTFNAYKADSALKPSEVKSVSPGSTFLGTMKIGGSQDGSVTVTSIDGTTYVVVVLRTAGGGTDMSTTSSVTSSSVTSTTASAG